MLHDLALSPWCALQGAQAVSRAERSGFFLPIVNDEGGNFFCNVVSCGSCWNIQSHFNDVVVANAVRDELTLHCE